MALRDRSIPTETMSAADFRPNPNAVYIFGRTSEARSLISAQWIAGGIDLDLIEITRETPENIVVLGSDGSRTYSLHSNSSLSDLLSETGQRTCYLDITGLPHHVWAPLLRRALELGRELKVMYVEPLDYKHSTTPTEGELFDLSERIAGITPLPGFISLAEFDEEKVCLIPLLGFEGTRFSHVLEHVHPTKLIHPIVGVPGFRPEFPFYTYQGNKLALQETRAWKRVRYVPASCPFRLFYALMDISSDHPGSALRIAPIGTKPHALGAVLYAMCRPDDVELIYDHPIKRAERSSGSLALHLYDVSPFYAARQLGRPESGVG